MARTTPDKRMFVTVADDAFRAGKPVASSNCRIQASAINHLYELVTGGAQAGETLTLDGSAEHLMPHDHSGEIDGYHHGVFIPRVVYTGLPTRYPALPFTDSSWSYNEVTVGFSGESAGTYAPARHLTAPAKSYSYITYAGHARIRARRGTQQLVCDVESWVVADASATDVDLYVAVWSSDWATKHDEDSITLGRTTTLGTLPASTDRVRSVTLDLGTPLTTDTDLWIVLGVKPDDDLTYTRDIYLWSLTVYEKQS